MAQTPRGERSHRALGLYRLAYDTHPDSPTRPDTFPGAFPEPNDDPTVADPALQRQPISGPRVSEARLLRPRFEESSSGIDHRLISTLPPPQSRRSFEPVREAPIYRPSPRPLLPETPRGAEAERIAEAVRAVDAARVTEKPRARERSRSDARPTAWYGSWKVLVAVSLTTVLAVAVGTSLANGELARLVASGPSNEMAPPPPAAKARSEVRAVVAPKVATPAVATARAAEEAPAPTVRFEDLPLATEKGTKKTKRSGRRR
jgi:hypothetical protein